MHNAHDSIYILYFSLYNNNNDSYIDNIITFACTTNSKLYMIYIGTKIAITDTVMYKFKVATQTNVMVQYSPGQDCNKVSSLE